MNRDIESVARYVSQVSNLPHWSRFYTHVGDFDGERYAVETMMGPATTFIHESIWQNKRQYAISSRFAERTETATIELREGEAGTQIRFHIRLPIKLGREHATRLLTQLQDELRGLKGLLEGQAPLENKNDQPD